MTLLTKTGKDFRAERPFGGQHPLPGLLVAYAPNHCVTVDRCLVKSPFVVGRRPSCDLPIRHETVSGEHFRISKNRDNFYIEDLGSTNHTFVDGKRLDYRELLNDHAVIRVGQAILVFHRDASAVFESIAADSLGFVGRFHLGELVLDLKEAVVSGRHLLFAGPTGSGKERAATAVCRLLGNLPLITHNAARFSSEEEAAATLFGVAPRVFSSVDARPGLIEASEGGALFLDEIHNLPVRVQRSLLRVIEEGKFARIGEMQLRPCRLRFLFASNAPPPTYDIAPDLLARLRVVTLLPLSGRKADIPVLFAHLLEASLKKHRVAKEPVFEVLEADHYEALLLDGFAADNVRGLIDIADRVASKITVGTKPEDAVSTVFSKRFENGWIARRFDRTSPEDHPTEPRCVGDGGNLSHYEKHRTLIATVWSECDGNLSKLERMLLERGIQCSRRWLAVYLDRWSLRDSSDKPKV